MSTRQEDLEVELREVVVVLKDVAGTQWYDLGLQLRLSPSTLDTIAAHHNADNHKRMMLRKWLQSDPEASWEKLAAALAVTGHETTAANVRSQYVQIAVETEQDEMRLTLAESNLQKIKAKFSSLSHDVQLALQSSQVSVNEVYDFLVRCFSRDDWIQNPSKFGQLFNALSVAKLWNYNHYSPLEEIIKKFLPDNGDIKKLVSEYKSHLTGFYTTTKIADFIKVHKSKFENTEQDPQESLPVDTYTLKDYHQLKVTLKLGQRKVSALTLSYVDELWRSLAEEFDLPSLTAIINTIVKGSLHVSWLILPHVAEKMMTLFVSTKAIKFFRLHDITQIEVDNHIVYDEEEMLKYETQLFEICQGKGDVNTLSELVNQHGVDINTINKMGKTPLCVAVECCTVNVVESLIQLGASVNQPTEEEPDVTPLISACMNGFIEIAELLIKNGAAVDHLSKFGQSPLYVASRYGERAAVKFLLQHGAQVNLATEGAYGESALIGTCWKGHADIAQLLLNKGAIVDHQCKSGSSALIISSQNGNAVEVVKVLLEFGAQVNLANDKGHTALSTACCNGCAETTRVLLNHGALSDYQNKGGWTPLACACNEGHSNVAEVLLHHGADVNHQSDYDGWTALMVAADKGNIKIVKMLIDHGAAVALRSKTGLTAYDIASMNSHPSVCYLLEQSGYQPHHSNVSSSTAYHQSLQPRQEEITSLETFRAILEYGPCQSQEEPLKHQTSHNMSEADSEETL